MNSNTFEKRYAQLVNMWNGVFENEDDRTVEDRIYSFDSWLSAINNYSDLTPEEIASLGASYYPELYND